MKEYRRKLLIGLLHQLGSCTLPNAVEQMWEESLLNKAALERLYVRSEVARRVRGGEAKTKAIKQLADELNCSYEKVRYAVYKKD